MKTEKEHSRGLVLLMVRPVEWNRLPLNAPSQYTNNLGVQEPTKFLPVQLTQLHNSDLSLMGACWGTTSAWF